MSWPLKLRAVRDVTRDREGGSTGVGWSNVTPVKSRATTTPSGLQLTLHQLLVSPLHGLPLQLLAKSLGVPSSLSTRLKST